MRSDPHSHVVDALERLQRALLAGDVGAAVECFVPDGALFGDELGEGAHGHDELARTFTAIVDRGLGAEWELDDTWAHLEVDSISFVADATVFVVVLGRRARRRRFRMSGSLRGAGGYYRFELFNGLDPVLGGGAPAVG